MNDKQIQAFLMICELGSMNQAAERLYISQPALKKRIDTLEEELEVSLLCRNSSGCELTAAGEIFLKGILPICKQMEELALKTKYAGEKKRLRICTLPDISMVEQDVHMIEFSRNNQDVVCERIALPTIEWMNALIEGKVEVFKCFYTKEQLKKYEQMGLSFVPDTNKVKLACVLSSQHPMAKNKTIDFEKLEGCKVYAGPLIYHYSGLKDYALRKHIDLQCDESAGKRYEMISKCEEGAVYIHPLSYAGELKPLSVIPLKGFSCLSGWIWKDTTSEVIRRFVEFCTVDA